MHIPHLPRFALALAAALMLAACGKPDTSAEDIRPVRYQLASSAAADSAESFSGQVRARYETDLAFRVGGKIVARLVNSGEHVKKGQVLARLDPADYQLDLSAKRAQLTAAESDLAQQKLNLKRYQELLAKQFISQAQVDSQQNAVNAARAKLEQAQAELSGSRNQTGYTQLTADADGVVSQIQAEPGLVVAAGQPVARLAQDGQREIVIAVPENRLQAVRAQTRFTVTLWADQRIYQGSLRELAADADPATRTYAARIALKDAADLPLGMTASVSLPSANVATGVKLPLTALLDEQGRHYLWLIDKDSKARRREVKVAAIDSASVTLSDALPAGSKVVTAGVHLLHDGQTVKLLDH
ncbi:efflux RND transporter periplasmic adaptor subunit [uncultured Aquitalea sp.]|uniref:efflux RND transporter periplasmic adaptor subunit n=1 Tax=uncultured Aquitalea sp. TaxID=540272 RepID=UPI0025DBBEFA|nr:efflux RND transporter periplasmic adaptor subunit [uncultured Aquitalea sp.]